MHFGTETPDIGRYLVDIDGCLRATDSARLSVADIAALKGGITASAWIAQEIGGELIPLAADRLVSLDEDRVAYFQICVGPRLFRSASAGIHYAVPADAGMLRPSAKAA